MDMLSDAEMPRSRAIVRRFALNLVRADKSEGSVKLRRKKAGWDPAFLLQILDAIPR